MSASLARDSNRGQERLTVGDVARYEWLKSRPENTMKAGDVGRRAVHAQSAPIGSSLRGLRVYRATEGFLLASQKVIHFL